MHKQLPHVPDVFRYWNNGQNRVIKSKVENLFFRNGFFDQGFDKLF